MAIAGHNMLVTAATAVSATYVALNGIKQFTLSDSRELLDITDFADGSVHARLGALRDATLSLSGDYEPTDTTGFGKVQATYEAGDDCVFQVWTNTGTSSRGYALVMKIESLEISGDVAGKAEISISASVNGTILTIA